MMKLRQAIYHLSQSPTLMYYICLGQYPQTKNAYSLDVNVEKDTCIWNDSFYDMSIEDFVDQVKKQSPKYCIVYIEYDYKQLGLGRDYFIDVCCTLGVDREMADLICREIMLQ